MYLWVMIATLLAAMAAYILPARNDMQKVVDEPVAETVVAKFLAQHIAGENFMTAHSTPYAGICSTDPEGDECKQQKRDRYVDYTPTGNDKLDTPFCQTSGCANRDGPHMPLGFVNISSYKSEIKCFNDNGGTLEKVESCYQESNPNIKRGLLTVGPIPQQWLYKVGDEWRPTSDIQEVLRKKFTALEHVGILRKNDQSVYSIHNFNQDPTADDFEIPDDFQAPAEACENPDVCFAYFKWK